METQKNEADLFFSIQLDRAAVRAGKIPERCHFQTYLEWKTKAIIHGIKYTKVDSNLTWSDALYIYDYKLSKETYQSKWIITEAIWWLDNLS